MAVASRPLISRYHHFTELVLLLFNRIEELVIMCASATSLSVVIIFLLQVLALKHHTSKLTDFPDLQSLATFGFRGEALSSLCALGDLTVETRTKHDMIATHLTFDHSGLLTAEKNTARQIGTTVTVKKLFSSLPVRSKEFKRNIRKEYGKLISLLHVSPSFHYRLL